MTPEETFARDCSVELRQIKSQFTIIGRAQRRFYYDVLIDGEAWGRLVPSATERFYYLHDAAEWPVYSGGVPVRIKALSRANDFIRRRVADGKLHPPSAAQAAKAARESVDRENEAQRQRERRETEIALRIGRRHNDIRFLLKRGDIKAVLKILDDETAIPVAEPAKVS